jgi:2-polyprenyl-6-methoxyphenol hydroxylase-like FAD-dependent oxidoreductase
VTGGEGAGPPSGPAPVDGEPHPSTPVAIVGGGPTGLALALGLARRGVRSVLLEREGSTSEHSRAPGIHVRTREVLRQWGVEDRFLEEGHLLTRLTLHDVDRRRPFLTLDLGELEDEADRPGLLILEQGRTEALLLEAVRATRLCDVRFGAEVVALEPGADGVLLAYRREGETRRLEAAYAVGCDGAGSFVRGALGLPFDGVTYSVRPVLSDVRVDDARDGRPWPRVSNARVGFTFAVRLAPQLWRVVRLDRSGAEAGERVPDEELDALVREVVGAGPYERVWASRFRIHRRAAPRFRVGRVLLAGDAAHLHSPAGGLGMNAGIQDAHNLAWKLARALEGGDVDRLLDAYDVERRAVVVGSVTRYADLLTRGVLQTPPPVRAAVFFLLRLLLRVPTLRRRALRRATMLDLDYPASPLLEADAPAAGRRLPNPLLHGPGGSQVRLHDLLPYGPSLVGVGAVATPPPELQSSAPGAVVHVGEGAHQDPRGVLVRFLGCTSGWISVRPDLHVDRVERL